MLNRILSKVEVQTNLGSNNLHSATANHPLDSSFLSMFPINNKEQFASIEHTIITEQEFVSKLVRLDYFKITLLISFLVLVLLCNTF